MKARIFIIVLLIVWVLSIANPIRADIGVGFILGEPTGFSLRIDGFPVLGIAWSLDDYFHLHCDYWINSRYIKRGVYWYWGFGGKVTSDKYKGNSFSMGMRVPIGLRYFPARRIEIFLEIAPGMRVYPNTASDFDIGIGMRFIL